MNKFKVGGAWKDTAKLFTKVSGAWKADDKVFIKVAGTWKLAWQSSVIETNLIAGAMFNPASTDYCPTVANILTGTILWQDTTVNLGGGWDDGVFVYNPADGILIVRTSTTNFRLYNVLTGAIIANYSLPASTYCRSNTIYIPETNKIYFGYDYFNGSAYVYSLASMDMAGTITLLASNLVSSAYLKYVVYDPHPSRRSFVVQGANGHVNYVKLDATSTLITNSDISMSYEMVDEPPMFLPFEDFGTGKQLMLKEYSPEPGTWYYYLGYTKLTYGVGASSTTAWQVGAFAYHPANKKIYMTTGYLSSYKLAIYDPVIMTNYKTNIATSSNNGIKHMEIVADGIIAMQNAIVRKLDLEGNTVFETTFPRAFRDGRFITVGHNGKVVPKLVIQ
jgi:hypothetical protein